ncbi:MAG: glycosyltransferase family 4 protein, partial [Candidatus Diapherotrites archaeon]|nr:glycosyltransferase family 4 protein [Candidatus Diapherotrites archaeon]
MRIFFITHTYSLGGSGGGEQFCYNFLKELRRRGHQVFVFTAGGKQFAAEEKKLGLQVYHCPTLGHHAFHKFEYVLFAWKAALLAKKFRPDVIHAQNDVFPALIGRFVKWRVGKPLVVAVEYLSDQAVSLNLKIVFVLNKLLLPKIAADTFVSWSKFVVDKFFIPWGIERKKIHIVPGAVNVKAFLKKNKPHPKLAAIGKNLIVSAKPLHKTNAAGI